VTIASAAAAAAPSLPVTAPFRPSVEGGGESGTNFAEQLSGLTVVLPGAGAWRSAGPSKAPKKAEGDTPASLPAAAPVMAQPLLPYTIYLPPTGTADPGDPPANNKKAAAPESLPQSLVPGPTAILGPAEGRTRGSVADQGVRPTRDGVPDQNNSAANPVTEIPTPAPPPIAVMPLPAPAPTTGDQTIPTKEAVSHKPGDASQPTSTADRPAAAGSAERPRELAFAAKVQPVAAVGNQALSGEMAAAAAAASSKKVVAPAAGANGSSAGAPAGAPGLSTSAMAAFERNLELASGPHSQPAASATRDAEALTLQTESLPKPAAPLKDISLQVTQPGKESVDVRVVQLGSEVRVSVHSGDPGLASGLRQGLSDLQSRLEENGSRAEMWRPTDSATPASPANGAHTAPGHSRGGDGQPQSGGSQQDGGRRNQNQSNQPRWVEELESSLTGGEESSGGSHGFGS